MARLTAVRTRDGMIDQPAVPALLGGVPKPEITVSTALEMYWPLSADKLIGKSQDQVRRWRNPRIKAVKNFIQVVEDKPIHEISGDDMLDFREWLLERINAGEIAQNSANKDLIHLGDVLKTVNKLKRLGLVLPLSDLSFKEGEAVTRPPFSDTWIKDKLLAPGALDRLNAEAAGILMAMVNTGARPSELAALTPECIHLNAKVPHISIEPIGRQLKTPNARRLLPLLGVSFDAVAQFPDGFPRYRQSPATLSGTINKYLHSNGLKETSRHSLYSLRHSFEDRLLAAGVDERIRRDLFGHALDRERYGAGASLEHLRELVSKVAF